MEVRGGERGMGGLPQTELGMTLLPRMVVQEGERGEGAMAGRAGKGVFLSGGHGREPASMGGRKGEVIELASSRAGMDTFTPCAPFFPFRLSDDKPL